MAPWIAYPYLAEASSPGDGDALREAWPALHRSDAVPFPEAPEALAAWAAFHAGRFETAVALGRAAGGSGATAADRAQLAQAHYLETHEAVRLRLCGEVVARAAARALADPRDANAHHLFAVALARQAQGANIGRALALGVLPRIRAALETAIGLAPSHVNAHVALGAFHVDVIDKLGALIARTQGIGKDEALAMFRTALKLDPDAVLVRNEYAHALLVLEGDPGLARATRLYREAAALPPRDAVERLEVEIARQALDETDPGSG